MSGIKVKICGITRIEDALLAQELGAWAVGFVFFLKSPRNIDLETARIIVGHLNPEIEKIGVFVNPSLGEIRNVQKIVGITKTQLHGNESPEFCREVGEGVIKVIRESEEDRVGAYSGLFAFLVDAERTKAGEWGGTGHLSNWQFAKQLKNRFPVILSGGISKDNVLEAVREGEPFAVDLSSSVETSPGLKDSGKMRAFFNNCPL